MDVAFILDKYFNSTKDVSIDVFDAQSLNTVYQDVVNSMTSHLEIEVSVLQALSYCLYEMMDNVHIHSGKPLGTAMTHYDDSQKTLRILFSHPKWILAGDSHLHGSRNERRDRSQSNRRSQD